MKYTIAIITCAVLFAILGLFAAWGASVYGLSRGSQGAVMMFIWLPLGGTLAGLIVGRIAAELGHRYTSSEFPQKNAVE